MIFFSLFLSPVMADTRTIQFQTGWNMFSLPLATSLSYGDIATQCPVASYLWKYDSNSGHYEKVQALQVGYGYWVKMKNSCSVIVNGNSLQNSDHTYSNGWNQIGANTLSVSFGDISSGCTVTSGPWKYNPSTGQYEEATIIEPGKGYLVKVSGDCGTTTSCNQACQNKYGSQYSGICSSTCSSGLTASAVCSSGSCCCSETSPPQETCQDFCDNRGYSEGSCLPLSGNGEMHYTGPGADYLMYYSDSAVSVWTQYTWTTDGVTYNGHADLANKFWLPLGLNVVKLGFTFPGVGKTCSYYDETKFDQVLSLFDTRGVKVIAALYPTWDAQYNGDGYCGSPKLKADWLAFAQRWKDDDRIVAFNLYGEPVGQINGGQGTGHASWYSGLNNERKNLALYFVDLVKSIHTIDPDRVVIYPYLALSYWNQDELIGDLEGTGIFEEPNTIFDVVHPYLFDSSIGGDQGTNPASKAIMYENSFIVPWVNRVGSSKVWCGETFMFTHPSYETEYQDPDMVRQKAFFVEMLNAFVRNRVGFDIWDILTLSPHYLPSESVVPPADIHKEAIEASNFDASLTSGGTTEVTCPEDSFTFSGCSSGTCCCSGTAVCSCSSSWTPGSCGAGSCSSTQRQYTRTCTPTGCTASDGYGSTKCESDSSCSSTTSTFGTGVDYRIDYESDSPTRFAQNFADFKAAGMDRVSIVLYWGTYESSNGNYISSEYTKLNHVLTAADNAGLKVHIDFHTLFPSSDSGWATPTNLGGNTMLILSGSGKTQFLNWITHTVEQIKSHPSISSYAVLNEPSRYSMTSTQKTQTIQLWTDAKAAVKALHNKPVGVRFDLAGLNYFTQSQVSNLDIMFINEYLDHRDPDYEAWGGTWYTLQNWIDWAHSQGKECEITEWNGYKVTPVIEYSYMAGQLQKLCDMGADAAYFWAWKGTTTWEWDLAESDSITPKVDLNVFSSTTCQ